MRKPQLLTQASLLLFVLLATSCSTVKRVSSPEDLIIGKWIVESVNVGGETVPASLLGREIAFEFNPDGTARFTTPGGTTEDGLYAVRQGKIYDPASPSETPVDIIELTLKHLIISMIDEGERLEMTLVAAR